jgi:dienelactone hydrolase
VQGYTRRSLPPELSTTARTCGAADKSVRNEDIVAFGKEMDAAGADWQFVNFSGAAHCFAEADAGNDPASNRRYDAHASRRAWRMLGDFFEESFGD